MASYYSNVQPLADFLPLPNELAILIARRRHVIDGGTAVAHWNGSWKILRPIAPPLYDRLDAAGWIAESNLIEVSATVPDYLSPKNHVASLGFGATEQLQLKHSIPDLPSLALTAIVRDQCGKLQDCVTESVIVPMEDAKYYCEAVNAIRNSISPPQCLRHKLPLAEAAQHASFQSFHLDIAVDVSWGRKGKPEKWQSLFEVLSTLGHTDNKFTPYRAERIEDMRAHVVLRDMEFVEWLSSTRGLQQRLLVRLIRQWQYDNGITYDTSNRGSEVAFALLRGMYETARICRYAHAFKYAPHDTRLLLSHLLWLTHNSQLMCGNVGHLLNELPQCDLCDQQFPCFEAVLRSLGYDFHGFSASPPALLAIPPLLWLRMQAPVLVRHALSGETPLTLAQVQGATHALELVASAIKNAKHPIPKAMGQDLQTLHLIVHDWQQNKAAAGYQLRTFPPGFDLTEDEIAEFGDEDLRAVLGQRLSLLGNPKMVRWSGHDAFDESPTGPPCLADIRGG